MKTGLIPRLKWPNALSGQRCWKHWFSICCAIGLGLVARVQAEKPSGDCNAGGTNTKTYTPTTETAVVDGFSNDWSLTETSIPMYTGGDSTKPQLSTIYLKQHCNADGSVTVYVLVLATTAGTLLQSTVDSWVRDSVHPSPIPWDAFAWVNPNNAKGTADGYEASFHLPAVGDYLLNFHAEVGDVNGQNGQTSSTTFPSGACGYVTIHLECKTITCGLTGVTVNGGTFCAVGDDPLVSASVLGTVVGPLEYVWTTPPGYPSGSKPGNVSSFVPLMAGTYSVIVTDLGVPDPGCSQPGQTEVVFLDCNGNGCPVQCPADIEFTCDEYPNADGTAANDPDPLVSGFALCSGDGCTASYTDEWKQGCGKSGQIIRTWKCEDIASGLQSTCTQIINIVDHTGPTLKVPGDVTVECDSIPPVGQATANDNCDPGDITINYLGETTFDGACANSYTLVRKWQAVDQCGNLSEIKSQTITVQDTTAPQLSGTPDADGGTVQCFKDLPTPPTVTALDNCDGVVPVSYAQTTSNGSGNCNNTVTRTWSAQDSCNNTVQFVQTILVNDTTPPQLLGTPDADGGTVQCFADLPPPPMVTADDNCDGSVEVTYDQSTSSGDSSCDNTVTRTWSAQDSCGNPVKLVQTIHVKDTLAPELHNLPTGSFLGCNPATLPSCDPGVTATDNCDGTVTVACTPGDVLTEGCMRKQTFTYSAQDKCLNQTSKEVTYTWKIDTEAPVIHDLPTGGDLGCNPDRPACLDLTASDNCDGDGLVVQCNPGDIKGDSCAMSQTFIYSVSDSCGNTTTKEVTYTWKEDKEAPTFNDLPSGGFLGCNPTTLPSCDPKVTATDNCDGTVTVVCTPGDVIIDGCMRKQTFTYSAQDKCKNTASTEVAYTWKVDTEPPVINGLPNGGYLGCNPKRPVCRSLTASDNCDGDGLVVHCTAGDVQGDSCALSQTFTYSVSDSCGNATTQEVTYTWKEDKEAPVINSLPTGGDLGCNPARPACLHLTASDNCDGDGLSVKCIPGKIHGDSCALSQTFTYSVSDSCGNTTTQEVNYTWKEDKQGPAFNNLPKGGFIGCNPAPEKLPSCDPNVTATDDCDGDVKVICTAGEITNEGCTWKQTFTYSAQDTCGNPTSQDVVYTWKVDKDAPIINDVPKGRDLGCNPSRPICNQMLTATDTCDGTLSVTCTAGDITGTACGGYSQTFTYSATDSCNNTTTEQVTYTWKEDTTPPIIAAVTPITKCYDPFNNANNTVTVTAPKVTDNCPLTITTATGTRSDGQPLSAPYPLGDTTITWTASDNCGNAAAQVKQTITIKVCLCTPSNGYTIGYWGNNNGKATLQGKDTAWRTLLSNLNLKNGAGADFNIPAAPANTFTTAFGALNSWLQGANAVNMAYMLSAQMAATTLNVNYKGLNGSTILFISKSLTVNGANVVAMLQGHSVPGFVTDINGNGYIKITDMLAAANLELGLHPITTSAGANRNYQECLKNMCDQLNNNIQPVICP